MNFIGVKKTKCRVGVRKKIEGRGMQERSKEGKMQGGGGVAKRFEGAVSRRGLRTQIAGGVAKKKIEGGMPERVKKTKCGGGGSVAKKKIEGGGYAGEGKEDKIRGGGCGKFFEGGGMCRRG